MGKRELNLINPSGSVPLYSSREIEVIYEEPEEQEQLKPNPSLVKEEPKAKEVENPVKGTIFYIGFTLFNSFCFVFAELLYQRTQRLSDDYNLQVYGILPDNPDYLNLEISAN
jgi:hypothetical protein